MLLIAVIAGSCIACATALVLRRRCKRERENQALRAARMSAPKSMYAVRSASIPAPMGRGGFGDEDVHAQFDPLQPVSGKEIHAGASRLHVRQQGMTAGAGAMHVRGGGTRADVKSQGRVLI